MTEKRLFLGFFLFFSFTLCLFPFSCSFAKVNQTCQAYEKACADKTTALYTWIKISYSFHCCKRRLTFIRVCANSTVLVRQDLVCRVKMLLEETKMLIMITRQGSSWYCPPLASSPLPLCPLSMSCQPGSSPPLLAVPVTQDGSCRRRGFCPLGETARGRQEGQWKHFLHLLHVDGGWSAIRDTRTL